MALPVDLRHEVSSYLAIVTLEQDARLLTPVVVQRRIQRRYPHYILPLQPAVLTEFEHLTLCLTSAGEIGRAAQLHAPPAYNICHLLHAHSSPATSERLLLDLTLRNSDNFNSIESLVCLALQQQNTFAIAVLSLSNSMIINEVLLRSCAGEFSQPLLSRFFAHLTSETDWSEFAAGYQQNPSYIRERTEDYWRGRFLHHILTTPTAKFSQPDDLNLDEIIALQDTAIIFNVAIPCHMHFIIEQLAQLSWRTLLGAALSEVLPATPEFVALPIALMQERAGPMRATILCCYPNPSFDRDHYLAQLDFIINPAQVDVSLVQTSLLLLFGRVEALARPYVYPSGVAAIIQYGYEPRLFFRYFAQHGKQDSLLILHYLAGAERGLTMLDFAACGTPYDFSCHMSTCASWRSDPNQAIKNSHARYFPSYLAQYLNMKPSADNTRTAYEVETWRQLGAQQPNRSAEVAELAQKIVKLRGFLAA